MYCTVVRNYALEMVVKRLTCYSSISVKKITKVELITVEKHILYFYGDHSQTLALKTIGKLTAIKKDYQKLSFHSFHQFLC